MCLHISWEPEKCSASKVVWSTSAQVTWKSQCSLGCLEHIVQSEQELKEIPPCRVGTNACQADPCKILGNSWLVKKEEMSKCPSVRTGTFLPYLVNTAAQLICNDSLSLAGMCPHMLVAINNWHTYSGWHPSRTHPRLYCTFEAPGYPRDII